MQTKEEADIAMQRLDTQQAVNVRNWLATIARLGGDSRWIKASAPGFVWGHYKTPMVLAEVFRWTEQRGDGNKTEVRLNKPTAELFAGANWPFVERERKRLEAADKDIRLSREIWGNDKKTFRVKCDHCGEHTLVRLVGGKNPLIVYARDYIASEEQDA